MSSLIQGITPLLEILCAFFFIISFNSLRDRVLELLDYKKWKKALIQSQIDKYYFLAQSMSQFDGLYVSHSVTTDIKTQLEKLDKEFSDYLIGLEKLDIRSTICFSRLGIVSGFYCLFILVFAGLPGNGSDLNLHYSLFYFSIIYGISVNSLAFIDLLNRWYPRKSITLFLHELSYNKSIFILLCIFIICLANYFLGFLNSLFLPTSEAGVVLIICLAPTCLIFCYYFNYLFQYRFFRRRIRPVTSSLKIVLDESKELYKRAKYTQNSNRGGFKMG